MCFVTEHAMACDVPLREQTRQERDVWGMEERDFEINFALAVEAIERIPMDSRHVSHIRW